MEVKVFTDLPRTETMVVCGPTRGGACTSVCKTEGKCWVYVFVCAWLLCYLCF